MPKVGQEHLDARRQQIVDAARARFAAHGFARTSMADIVAESGLSTGAIYRYFTSKDEIVVAVCEAGQRGIPDGTHPRGRRPTSWSTCGRAPETGTRPADRPDLRRGGGLAARWRRSSATTRRAARGASPTWSPTARRDDAGAIAEAFVALCSGYTQQLAVRGDLDPAPFAAALMAIVEER